VTVGVSADPWAGVVGQPAAVAQLRAAARAPVHAYLLVGPRGAGKRALAAAFAAELLSAGRPDPGRHVALALAEEHPDLTVVTRTGASIDAEQVREVVRLASRAPVEGDRKVLVLDEFHLVAPNVVPILLKTLEEPPPSTVLVVLAEEVPPALVTIASRCVRVEVGPVPEQAITEALVAEGLDRDRATMAASAAAGDLRRARVLARDDGLEERRRAWAAVPDRLDGTGAAVVATVDALLAMIDESLEPLRAAQAEELARLEERVARLGERGSGRRELTERHKREERRHRTDELRFGLLTLARRFRDELVHAARPGPELEALEAIQATAEGLARNPNVTLQLQALFAAIGAPRSLGGSLR
jgi:DNA polymerase-3 subunit delta'